MAPPGKLERVAFWGALPWVLPQALWVRQTAPRFRGADGPNAGSVGEGPPLQLLALGDSIIAGVGARTLAQALVGQTAAGLAAQRRRRVHWRAYGRIGAATAELPALLASDAGPAADIVLLSTGVNDVTGLAPSRRWQRSLAALLAQLRQQHPQALLVFAGLPPLAQFPLLPTPLRQLLGSRARRLDALAREILAAHPGTLHVPVEFPAEPTLFCADGFHPSELGYARFGAALATAVGAHKATVAG